jgi:hypothetical protein
VPEEKATVELLGYERFLGEGNFTYIILNRQTPFLPRGAVPVNTGAGFASVSHLKHARFAFGHGGDFSRLCRRPC